MTEQEQTNALKTDLRDCHSIDEWASREFCEAYTDYGATAEKLVAKGWRKQVEGCWRVVSYTDSEFYTHSILTCSVCGTKQAAITSMFPNHCYECGSRMTETVLEKVIRFEEEWKGGDI
jgi:hypothetical protein